VQPLGRRIKVPNSITAANVDSQTAWRIATRLPAALRNSHRNGGSVFLIFVADPRTTRLCTVRIQEPGSPTQDPLPTPVPRVR
jgi:hypothetical protein